MPIHDKPLAASGLSSYRYKGAYGWIMIGARDDADALQQAPRSTGEPATLDRLQKWDGKRYVNLGLNPQTPE